MPYWTREEEKALVNMADGGQITSSLKETETPVTTANQNISKQLALAHCIPKHGKTNIL
jgi:hypothetical protein